MIFPGLANTSKKGNNIHLETVNAEDKEPKGSNHF